MKLKKKQFQKALKTKQIIIKIIRTKLIQIQTRRWIWFLKELAWNSRWEERKEWGNENKVYWIPIVVSPCTWAWLSRKGQHVISNTIMKGDVWFIDRHYTCLLKSANSSN
jgi:hypothetical protein